MKNTSRMTRRKQWLMGTILVVGGGGVTCFFLFRWLNEYACSGFVFQIQDKKGRVGGRGIMWSWDKRNTKLVPDIFFDIHHLSIQNITSRPKGLEGDILNLEVLNIKENIRNSWSIPILSHDPLLNISFLTCVISNKISRSRCPIGWDLSRFDITQVEYFLIGQNFIL